MSGDGKRREEREREFQVRANAVCGEEEECMLFRIQVEILLAWAQERSQKKVGRVLQIWGVTIFTKFQKVAFLIKLQFQEVTISEEQFRAVTI